MLNKNQQTEATKFQPIAFRVKELAEKNGPLILHSNKPTPRLKPSLPL